MVPGQLLGSHFLEYQQRMTKQYKLEKQHCCNYYSWYNEGNLKRQEKTEHFELHYPQKNKWSVISKLFWLNCIFDYISNWSEVLEFYLTSFLNAKNWRVKFRNFLGDFLVHYAALFINRTINSNYLTLLMALHNTHDGF